MRFGGIVGWMCIAGCSSGSAAPSAAPDTSVGGSGGSAGSGGSSPSPCAGVDLASDPDHCGACGFGCGGGACIEGRCQPVVLASDQFFADSAVLSEGRLYYASGGDVRRLEVGGSEPVEVVTSDDPTAWWTPLAVAAESMFWFVHDRELHRADPRGDGAELVSSFEGLGMVTEMRLDGGALFFTAAGWNDDLDPGGKLVRVESGRPTVLVEHGWGTRSLSLWGEHVYFAESGIWDQGIEGSIARIPRGGGPAETLVAGYPADVVADEDGIYWTEPFSGRLLRAAHDGSGVKELFGDPAIMPQPLVVHGESIAFADVNAHAVWVVPRAGGRARIVAEDVFTTRLASDGHFVYWASRGRPENAFADGWVGKLAVR